MLVTADSTDAELDALIAEGDRRPQPVAAIDVRYLLAGDVVAVEFANGIEVRFPRKHLAGLESGTVVELRDVQIEPSGLYWPQLDVAHYFANMLDCFGDPCRILSDIGRRGGARKSDAKTAAVRENGKKGGRPRKRLS